MSKRLKGALLTSLAGICWGCSGTVGQYLFTYQGMDSKWLVPIRLGVAGIILLIFDFAREGAKTFDPWRSRTDAVLFLIYGIPGVAASQLLYFYCIQYSSAAVGTILQDLAPISILIVSCVLHRTAPSALQILSIALALTGVFLIVTRGRPGDLAVSPRALISGVCCCIGSTIYSFVSPVLQRRHSIYVLQGWAFLLGGIFCALIFHSWTIDYTPNVMGILGIAFVVVVGNIIAFCAYGIGLKYIGPETSILYGFSEPVTAAVIAVAALGTPFTVFDFLGFACIFLMIVLISRKPKTATLPDRN